MKPAAIGLAGLMFLLAAGSPLAQAAETAVTKCQNGDFAACKSLKGDDRRHIIDAGNKFAKAWGLAKTEELFIPMCNDGIGVACFNLSVDYRDAKNSKKDLLFKEKSCTAGYSRGCELAALVYDEAKDYKRSVPLFERACQLKLDVGCFDAGLAHLDINDEQGARKYFNIACDMSYARGCTKVGYYYLDEIKDLDLAQPFFTKGCNLGDIAGCNSLGVVLVRKGQNQEALPHFRKSCEEKYGHGCYNLAIKAPDEETAIKYLGEACDYKHSTACYKLGKYFLKPACSGNDCGAEKNADGWSFDFKLISYKMESISPENAQKGRDFIAKACKLGLAEACQEDQKLLAH